MAAFDWSPGGCCCVVPGGFFDMYRYGGAQPAWPEKGNEGKFARPCSMFPANSASSDLNDTSYPEWVIDTPKPLRTWGGWTSDGRSVWTEGGTSDGASFMAVFDVTTKQQLASFTPDTNTELSPQFGPASAANRAAVNATQFAEYATFALLGANRLVVRGIDGSTVVTGPLSATRTTANNGFESVITFAPLDWPHAATSRLTMIPGPPGSNSTLFSSFEFMQCELGSGVDGFFSWGNPTTVRHVDYDSSIPPVIFGQNNARPQAQWLGYDHFNNNWAAGIFYETTLNTSRTSAFPNSFHNKIELIIGGQVVLSAVDVVGSKVAIPHICFPHETLGDGYVAVVQSTVMTSSISPTELVVYKNGAEVWRTDSSGHVTKILGSTDRWIYFQTAGACTIPQVTRGEFSSSTGSETTSSGFWVARHDGTQIIPLGILNDTFGKIQILGTGGSGNLAANGVNDFCFARDSTVIPNTLPATYQEMYDGRHSP